MKAVKWIWAALGTLAAFAVAAFLLSNAKRHSRKVAQKNADAKWIEDNRAVIPRAAERAKAARQDAVKHIRKVTKSKAKANEKIKKLEDAGSDVRKLTDLYNSL